MEKYNKLLRNITELIEKGLFTSKDLKREVEEELEDKKINIKISSKEESEEEKTGWGQFWKDQYDSNDSNNNQISAGDFN